MNTTRTLLLPLLFGLVVIASSAAAQNESKRLESYENMLPLLNTMPEPGEDFGIIKDATTEIEEHLDQINVSAEETMAQLFKAREARDHYMALSNDSSRDEGERLLNHVKALEASVRLNLDARKATQRHQEHLVEIEKQLEQVIKATHRLESEKAETRSLISEIEQHTHGTACREKLIAELIEVIPLDALPGETLDASKLSAQQNVLFEGTLNLLKASSNLPDYSSRYEELGQKVTQRRHFLYLTEAIIEENLKHIGSILTNRGDQRANVKKYTRPHWLQHLILNNGN